MTRVFVYEYTCAVAADPLAAALNAEGAAMLDALLHDFSQIPGVDAFTVRSAVDEPTEFRAAVRRSDWALIIAPEFQDILRTRCQWAMEEGGRLLGPSLVGIELCSDKLRLARHWQRNGVPTPETIEAGSPIPWSSWIVKPRFGAGSLATVRCGDPAVPVDLGPLIVQEEVVGLAASVAFLAGPGQTIPLLPAEQQLSLDDRFTYLGGRLPLPPTLAARAITIGHRAAECVPGLTGYFGIDVVLGNDGRDYAIEINPRMTTSYVGLRALAEINLAESMLLLMSNAELPKLTWRPGSITFRADGSISSAT